MSSENDFFLTSVCAGRQPDWAGADFGAQGLQQILVRLRRRRGELKIANVLDGLSAEFLQARRAGHVGGEQNVIGGKQARGALGKALPIGDASWRKPCVDERQRNARLSRAQKHVRPEFAFREHREVRPPMHDEARGRRRAGIERGVLMDRARQDGGRDVCGRSGGAGCDQEMQVGSRFVKRVDE